MLKFILFSITALCASLYSAEDNCNSGSAVFKDGLDRRVEKFDERESRNPLLMMANEAIAAENYNEAAVMLGYYIIALEAEGNTEALARLKAKVDKNPNLKGALRAKLARLVPEQKN
jgi:hypothetical protein